MVNILVIESEYLIFDASRKSNKIDKISQRICQVRELWADKCVAVKAVYWIAYSKQKV